MRRFFLFLKMQQFLKDYVHHHLNHSNQVLDDQILILPSKRSVAALKNEFLGQHKSLWLPEIIDILSFIERLSNLEIINHEQTLLEFYKVYYEIKKNKNPESFENFYSWASILVNDFNEIDRFLVDAEKFFEHHKALKKLNYFGVDKTQMIKSYISFWEELPQYYNALQSHLLNQGLAYQGLSYRKAYENIDTYLKQHQRPVVFIGFNALNTAEEKIVEACLSAGNCKIAWDIDQSFLEDQYHPANTFIKKYKKKWLGYQESFINLKSSNFSKPKSIQILSSPKHIGQSKSVSIILKNLSKEDIKNTAIILNDEDLLNPILNSIPKKLKDVNITMGLPLNQTPISDFFTLIIDYQKQHNKNLSYKTLKNLLQHRLIRQSKLNIADDILSHLQNQKLLSITHDELLNLKAYNQDTLKLLNCLKSYTQSLSFIDSLLELIEYLLNQNQSFHQYLLAYQNLFLELKSNLESYPDLSIAGFIMLFKEKEQSQKLSFKGSKSKGLQIMGMLESRLLDFETVIITSVNEGILPAGKSENSYITYNLKKQYGLPTHTEKDAIYAYHFFRLLQRAKKCFIIYDNDQSGFNKGEKSRFISYLEIFKSPKHLLTEKQFSLSTQLESQKPIEIEKTTEILKKLKTLAENGFSPTALTTYILNPILFYKRYVLKVKELETFDDVINYRDFGTVMHQSIEELYKIKNTPFTAEILNDISEHSNNILKAKFDEVYAKNIYQSGLNRIQFETAKAYLKRFLDKEKQALSKSSTKILDIEKNIETNIKTEHHQVKLKGQIDRIDTYDDTLRIIDLKTGKVEPKHLKFDDFEKLITDYDYSKAFQILFYAYVYSQNNKINSLKAGIISFKNLNNWFMPLKYDKAEVIDDSVLESFEVYLSRLIDEILDPDIPFKEKETIFES